MKIAKYKILCISTAFCLLFSGFTVDTTPEDYTEQVSYGLSTELGQETAEDTSSEVGLVYPDETSNTERNVEGEETSDPDENYIEPGDDDLQDTENTDAEPQTDTSLPDSDGTITPGMDEEVERQISSLYMEDIPLLRAAGDVNSEALLRQAIADAPAGTQTVITLTGDVTLTGSAIVINGQNILLQSSGGEHTVKVSNDFRHFEITSGTLTLTDGVILSGNNIGGGLAVGGSGGNTATFTMVGGEIRETVATSGPAVAIENTGNFVMDGGKITYNIATEIGGSGGAVIVSGGTFTMNDGEISNNMAYSGGGVYIGTGTFNMTGGAIINNTSQMTGGGLAIGTSGNFNMSGGEISDNTTLQHGGGVYNSGSTNVVMSGGKISSNKGSSGGGVCLMYGSFTMSGGIITDNTGTNGGGVHLWNNSSFILSGDGKITDNKSPNGAGVYVNNSSNLTINGGEISNNTATSSGGGVYVVSSANLVISGGKITKNAALSGGGAYVYINSNGSFSMSGGEISNNTARSGGGVDISSQYNVSVTMSGGKISGNITDYSGSGVNLRGVSLTMIGGEISNNIAGISGAGIDISVSSSFILDGGIISGNIADYNGGGVSNSGSFTMYSGEITSNTATNNGGGIDTTDYGSLKINGGSFANNVALAGAYSMDLENTSLLQIYAQTVSGLTSISAPFGLSHEREDMRYAFNNYDINYTNGTMVRYTVTYNANGGSGGITATVIPERIGSHTVYNAAQASVSKFGYKLDGWATSATGAVMYTPGQNIAVDKDIELFAVWSHDGATYHLLNYHPNGGSGGTQAKIIPEESHTIYTQQQAEVTRYGYKVVGWATEPNGEVTYRAGETITFD